jgi:hypothetical protein
VDENEVEEIDKNLESLNLEKTFLADGKFGKLNRYLIFQTKN